MVVDEAHHLSWSVDKPSTEYQRIEELSRDIAGLICLLPPQINLATKVTLPV